MYYIGIQGNRREQNSRCPGVLLTRHNNNHITQHHTHNGNTRQKPFWQAIMAVFATVFLIAPKSIPKAKQMISK